MWKNTTTVNPNNLFIFKHLKKKTNSNSNVLRNKIRRKLPNFLVWKRAHFKRKNCNTQNGTGNILRIVMWKSYWDIGLSLNISLLIRLLKPCLAFRCYSPVTSQHWPHTTDQPWIHCKNVQNNINIG